MNVARFNLIKENSRPNSATMHTSPAKEHYKELLAESMFESAESISEPVPDETDLLQKSSSAPRILSFTKKAPAPAASQNNRLRVLYTQNKTDSKVTKSVSATRHIPAQPEKILDAPELLDDYYLNLLDWNCQNVLAVALGRSVYLWNATSGTIQHVRRITGAMNLHSQYAFTYKITQFMFWRDFNRPQYHFLTRFSLSS
jgi:cell division cycle 20, cofactor of APC complex